MTARCAPRSFASRGQRHKPRRCYRKAGDEPLLVLIRRFVDERPTYGYRRITRLVNRQQRAEGKSTINAKRVLRIMQVNKLTLQRHTGRRPGRTHDGVVIALRSNIRWCSSYRGSKGVPCVSQTASSWGFGKRLV
jgi:putative transposase